MVQTRSTSSTAVPRLSPSPPSPTKRRVSSRGTPAPTSASSALQASAGGTLLSHTPSTTALVWLAISLPLVAWDSGYVLLRPHSMPGGAWHAPWTPYELYGRVDHVYGAKRWDAGDGFCGAQGTMNVIESIMYLAYLWLWHSNKTASAAGGARAAVTGRPAALAMLIMFSACLMTLSKTVLYWLNESWSGFDNIGHNTTLDLVSMWIIPNGAWIIVPSYLVYTYGRDIANAMVPSSANQKTE